MDRLKSRPTFAPESVSLGYKRLVKLLFYEKDGTSTLFMLNISQKLAYILIVTSLGRKNCRWPNAGITGILLLLLYGNVLYCVLFFNNQSKHLVRPPRLHTYSVVLRELLLSLNSSFFGVLI